MAPQGRGVQHSRDTSNTNQAKQPDFPYLQDDCKTKKDIKT